MHELPGQTIDSAGVARVDQRAVVTLGLPLMENGAIHIVLSLANM
jgi:hypothetical protein